jgi:hypothetical protein
MQSQYVAEPQRNGCECQKTLSLVLIQKECWVKAIGELHVTIDILQHVSIQFSDSHD